MRIVNVKAQRTRWCRSGRDSLCVTATFRIAALRFVALPTGQHPLVQERAGLPVRSRRIASCGLTGATYPLLPERARFPLLECWMRGFPFFFASLMRGFGEAAGPPPRRDRLVDLTRGWGSLQLHSMVMQLHSILTLWLRPGVEARQTGDRGES